MKDGLMVHALMVDALQYNVCDVQQSLPPFTHHAGQPCAPVKSWSGV